MKKLTKHFVFALAGLLSTTAWAAWGNMVTLTTIAKGDATTTNYAGLSYNDGTSVLKNEAMGLLLVYATSGADLSSISPTDLFAIDRAGQVVLKETYKDAIAGVTWAVCKYGSNSFTQLAADVDTSFLHPNLVADPTLSRNALSIYFDGSSPYYKKSYRITMSDPDDIDVDLDYDEYPYMYLVTFDRRTGNDPTLEAGTTRVAKWNALYLGQYSNFGIGGGFTHYLVLNDASLTLTNTNGDLSGYTKVTYPKPMVLPVAITSWTAGGTAYTGDALTNYLMPEIGTFTLGTDGTIILEGDSNDICSYTLQTKASLDDKWENMDAVIEKLTDEQKKSLASQMESCYTCLRVKESTQIKIPQIPGETQRFYRLVVEYVE